jgi:hypothetical protein
MNERTNKPSRPIVVGFGSVPGGTGCTTLAIHAATYAARQGLHTLAISIDPSADMLRRMGVDDDALYIDAHYVKEDRLNLAVMPPEGATYDVRDALPNLGFGGEVQNPEIIILDMGPGVVTGSFGVRADYWVVPIQDLRSLASIEQRTFPQGIFKTLFVLSQVSHIACRRECERAGDYLKRLNPERAQLLGSYVPCSGLLRRTASERKTIWQLTTRSMTTFHVETFCRELLGKVDREMDAIFQAEVDALVAQSLAMEIDAPLANPPSSGPLPSDDVQDETLKAAQAGLETNPPTQDKPDHKQQELKRLIEQEFAREKERLRDGLPPATNRVVPKASRRKK